MTKIDVLDRGYVRMVDVMGSDLTVVNSARVSYAKESAELTDRDRRLIAFLAREGHSSPFRHAIAQFEIYAPLMVARQWFKYVVGSDHTMDAWNESSRRYITEEPEFYVPAADQWRSAPESSKQGSGGAIDRDTGWRMYNELNRLISYSERLYTEAMEAGVCAEQARLFLPAYGLYVRWYWTGSLQSVAHFLNQRLAHDSQAEIQAYAAAVLALIEAKFPVAISELVTKIDEGEAK